MTKNNIKIAPSILSADFANLESEIKAIEKAGANMIHIDVMDGHFVPNLTFGPPVIKALRKTTELPFDVHLMIDAPEKYIDDYADAGADIITIHPESTMHLDRTLNLIKKAGKKAGISLLPSSTAEQMEYIIDLLGMILVMSVNPGFGGQKFLPSQLKKIEQIAQMIAQVNHKIELSVDGGINDITAKSCINAGASMLVAGSYIFAGDYSKRINKLKAI